MPSFSQFWSDLSAKKGGPLPRIAFADGTDTRVIRAATELGSKNLLAPLLVGARDKIMALASAANIKTDGIEIASITTDLMTRSKEILLARQKKSNLTATAVDQQFADPLYQAIGLLILKEVDGLVAGSLRPTADIVRAALQCVGTKPHNRLISGHFLIESDHLASADRTPFLFADCAVMPEPSAASLAAIARGAAASFKFFTGREPRVALLSFSTRGSAKHPLVDRIQQAVKMIREQDPQLVVDGELQVDAALDRQVALIKNAQDSSVAGRPNVFVFPTLESGNIGYKLVQRFSQAKIAGPLLWGLDRPMSDLSRGCTVEEITDTALCVSAMVRGLN